MASSDIYLIFFLRATAHLTNNAIIKITWKNDKPIWTEQCPLMKEKLQAAKELIRSDQIRSVAQSCPTAATPWTAAYQGPPSMGFSRQEYWSGVPLPSPNLPI